MEIFDHAAWRYFKGTPSLGWVHGPHRDTWYGHSFGGINLWLAVDGTNRDNSMVFYPDAWTRSLPYDTGHMYIAPGAELPRAEIVTADPGQVIVFPSELPHSSVVNVSDRTRIVVSTRLNTRKPRFLRDAYWHHTRWIRSEDVEAGEFDSVQEVPLIYDSCGDYGVDARPEGPEYPRLKIDAPLEESELDLGIASDQIGEGERLLVDFVNRSVLLLRCGGQLKALSPRCPHLGLEMIDGYLDRNGVLFCPGHGLYFGVDDGRSPRCANMRLHSYPVREVEGRILLRKQPRELKSGVPTATS